MVQQWTLRTSEIEVEEETEAAARKAALELADEYPVGPGGLVRKRRATVLLRRAS